MPEVEFSELKGQTLANIIVGYDEIIFITNAGKVYKMLHQQDCCENVYIESITGDISDIISWEILLAEEITNDEPQPGLTEPTDESFLWTFYKLATIQGRITIRWLGESNGYYSESVTFYLEKDI